MPPPVRSTQVVFDDHLRLAAEGDVEADLARNYHRDCVILIDDAPCVYRGHDGVDSFVIEHGLIVAQTIHYTVQRHP
jgi:hypothetical protein